MSVQVFFERGRYDIKPGFMGNGENFSLFLTRLDSLSNRPDTQIDSVLIISSSSSPEGNSRMNAILSDKRAAALQRLLEKNISEKNVRFVIRSAGEDWESLGLLLKDSGIKGREAAADIIGNTPEYIIENGQITGGRKKAMMDYDYGRLWWKMDEQLFPLLRQATVHVFHSKIPGDISSTELKVKGMDTPKQVAQQYAAAGIVRPLFRFTTTASHCSRSRQTCSSTLLPCSTLAQSSLLHKASALRRSCTSRGGRTEAGTSPYRCLERRSKGAGGRETGTGASR